MNDFTRTVYDIANLINKSERTVQFRLKNNIRFFGVTVRYQRETEKNGSPYLISNKSFLELQSRLANNA